MRKRRKEEYKRRTRIKGKEVKRRKRGKDEKRRRR
jgi:hypothetical protein